MNRLSRFCVCRSRSVLRRSPYASKPISSLISNNPTSSNLIILISKFHHTFNYPSQISSTPGNQFRKYSGDPAADFNADDLKNEINELYQEIGEARDDIELQTLPPPDIVKIPVDKLKALLEKFGLDKVKYRDYPPHLQSFEKEIEFAKECVSEIVDFGTYAAAGKYSGVRPYFCDFKKWYDAGGMVELESSESKNKCGVNYQGIINELGASRQLRRWRL